jgi:hypothetical protein
VILMSLILAAHGGQCQSAVTSLEAARWGSAVHCFIAVGLEQSRVEQRRGEWGRRGEGEERISVVGL